MQKIKEFARKNILISVMFLVVTVFFLVQHGFSPSWDFSSYVLNAKCFFYDGQYCETQRPPLASFILAPFIIFGTFGEWIYIIIVSLLFFYASIKSADTLFNNMRIFSSDILLYRLIFYFFSLGIFTLLLGLKEGTELLTLSLLELALVQVLRQKNAGFYLGLAFLSRYPSLVFIPFLFFNPRVKGIIKNIIAFAIVVFPWFLWNFVKYGNWFTGFVDGYAQNIVLRQVVMPLTLEDVFTVTNYFIIPVVLGIIIASAYIFSMKKDLFMKNSDGFIIQNQNSPDRQFCTKEDTINRILCKENVPIILIGVFSAILIWNYSTIPTKFPRYLFNLILPIAFFSTLAGIFLLKYVRRYTKAIKLIILILFFFTVIAAGMVVVKEKNFALPFEEVAREIYALGIENCEILSPHWVPVTYYTENVYPLGNNAIVQAVENNKTLLIFPGDSTPDDSFTQEDLKRLPVFKMTADYVFYAKIDIQKICAKKYKYDEPYVSDHCLVVAQRMPRFLQNISYSFCSSINIKS